MGSIPGLTSGEEVIVTQQIVDPPPSGGDTYNQKGIFDRFGLGTTESNKVLYAATLASGTIN